MEHPNLARVRHHRSTLNLAEQSFHIVIRRTMEERPNSGPCMYTAEDVAKAAGMSRARVYQIIDQGRSTE